ncbi:MAG TPA: class I SAM-dependent methyltransferase [Myxococcota bacterium]|nr:class I SAM-dependent methyltransferase [Myxococcota bacterium]
MEATGPNAEQIEYWNKQAGPKWVAEVTRMDALIAPLGQLAQEAARPRPGERVLDVGCGTGQTSVQLAAKVGPTGSVLGVDISTPMLEWARKRARDAGLANVQFENADAQTHALPASHFDLCFSRFGVMFFIDPLAAFKNLARALKPGGRVAFVCWQPFLQNAWVREPMLALSKVVQLPPPPPPGTPGPFAFGDGERTRGILEQAGFSDVSLAGKTAELKLGQTVDEASAFAVEIGPVGAQLRDAPESTRRNAAAAIREALAPHAGPQGVTLGCAVWIATGTRK